MSDDKRKIRPTFWWWKLEDLIKNGFFDAIFKEGWRDHLRDEVKGGRLEHRPNEDLKESLIVYDNDGEPCGAWNESHRCPFDCG